MENIKKTAIEIDKVCDSIKEVLKEKNMRYGNSALEPMEVFSRVKDESIPEGILIRLDDKLSRIKNVSILRKNDVFDIIGYLILICVNKEWNNFDQLVD